MAGLWVWERYLGGWLTGACQRARRATLAIVYAGDDARPAEIALRVIGEHGDRLRGCRLSVLVLADGTEDLPARLGAVEAQLPPQVAVHLMPGAPGAPGRLSVALRAAGAAGAPVLSYLGTGGALDPATLAAAATGRPAEVLVLSGAGTSLRPALADAGFPLVTEVELADPAGRIGFGTGSDRNLEALKEAVWATGAALRDPDGVPLRADLPVDVAPLAGVLLAELVRHGPRTVTELRRHAVTDTAYRATDAVRALTGLLDAGQVSRDPEQGRLGGDVLVTAVRSTA
ncbi:MULTISPECIES: hypothetical protein [Micromonospora]|uniref:Uncharacterized protein n=1 Tax=Micromonospora maris TaxID=1003110 RepID=A0A9X0I8P7_9ACTN|nr:MULTISPECIES: hypothetical protein [Micromonospora]AEB43759.1 hypothetical protein VAB18032_13225 [Micromonospora maris AB-18-032]KUJ49033.1 hypothetical protein ADL17_08670 [Micromonospora maris]RUL91887.1 hypothetical protein EG812_18220 [Verrucosispora sp. FIM060022]